jgi:hypothetical protein
MARYIIVFLDLEYTIMPKMNGLKNLAPDERRGEKK